MMEIREYRRLLSTAGQASPPALGHEVVAIMKELRNSNAIRNGLSVIDVGCGLGHQMALINAELPGLFNRIEGIDWSPATVAKHQSDPDSVYEKVTLCSSDKLPYTAGQFDIALSMENIEHLYGDRCIGAIAEMTRIATKLIVTTPLPYECINFLWLYPEIVEAIKDEVPLSEHDFICLESAVHKSTVFPSSMKAAGFTCIPKGHGLYIGESSNITWDQIRCAGIDPETIYSEDALGGTNLGLRYLKLLAQSAELHKSILASPDFEAATPHVTEPMLAPAPVPEILYKRKRSWISKILRRQ